MQILVAPLLEMPAQTRPFNACLVRGLNGTSRPTFTCMFWQCLLSCTVDSSVQMMLSKLSWFYKHISNSSLFCLFVSKSWALIWSSPQPTTGIHAGVYATELIITPKMNLQSSTEVVSSHPPAATPPESSIANFEGRLLQKSSSRPRSCSQ